LSKKSSAPQPESVFLNLPFDSNFEPIFVAYVVGLVTLGFIPRSVLELDEDGAVRMERLFRLMRQCQGSVHDLSYGGKERRYNMPLELGVAYALTRLSSKKIYVFEAKKYILKKNLSDLSHFDPKIHGMKGEKALVAIYDCFDSRLLTDPIEIGRPIYKRTIKRLPEIRQGRDTLFNRSSFRRMLYFVSALTDEALKNQDSK
jgi:hypothetical protein